MNEGDKRTTYKLNAIGTATPLSEAKPSTTIPGLANELMSQMPYSLGINYLVNKIDGLM